MAGPVALNSTRAAGDLAGLVLLAGLVCWGHLLGSWGPTCAGPGQRTELEKAPLKLDEIRPAYPSFLRASLVQHRLVDGTGQTISWGSNLALGE